MLAAQSCPTLRDPMVYSPPGSSVHGISQAKILEYSEIRPMWEKFLIYTSMCGGIFSTS